MPAPVEMGGMPQKGVHGSSNQLFILLEEDSGITSQAEEAPETPKASGLAPASLSGSKVLKATALTAAAAMVCCAVGVAVAGASGRGIMQEGGAGFERKSAVIGSSKVPEDLDPAPEPKLYTIGHPSYHCSYTSSEYCPASELFYNSDVVEVATENLMQVGRGIFAHKDRDLVRDTVAAGFENISKQIKEHANASLQALEHIQLDVRDKNAVLTWLRLMSVPQVQSIGYEVALAMRRVMSSDPATVVDAIEDVLSVNLVHIKELRDELIAPGMLKYWGSGHQWELTLDQENLAVMQAFKHGEFYGSLDADFYSKNVSGVAKSLPRQEKAYGAWGGVLEQGRALIDIIKLLANHRNIELLVPPQATSLDFNVDIQDLGSELLSCELQKKDGMNNFMKALFCPLKYGSQGMDALRALSLIEKGSTSSA